MRLPPLLPAFLLALLAACSASQPATRSETAASAPAPKPPPPLQSEDILAREQVTRRAMVKHILIGWDALKGNLGDRMDPRAAARTEEQAVALVEELLGRVKAGEPFEQLMAEYSEDGGSASTGRAYEVQRDSQLVFMFRRLGLRLHPDEVGVVASPFGYHIMKRVE
jgi:hypothetical protein